MTGRVGWRVLRAAVFGTASTVLAALAHSLSGAMLPPVGVLFTAAVVLTAAAVPLTRRERGVPVIAAATLLGQLVAHTVLTVAMSTACGGVSGVGAATGTVPMSMGDGAPGTTCTGGSWLPAGGTGGLAMLAGHLLAAAVMAWSLGRGERAVTRLAVLARRVLGPVVRLLLAAAAGVPLMAAGPFRAVGVAPAGLVGRRGLVGTRVWVRRGPPRGATA